MRIMGLDYGTKTVGVAISDELLITAQGVEIIRRDKDNKIRRTLARIEELITEYDVREIVLGLPLNMDDSVGERAQAALEFKDRLERRTGLPVTMYDERLSTVEAIDLMNEFRIRREDRHEFVDKIAATIILQGYLDERGN